VTGRSSAGVVSARGMVNEEVYSAVRCGSRATAMLKRRDLVLGDRFRTAEVRSRCALNFDAVKASFKGKRFWRESMTDDLCSMNSYENSGDREVLKAVPQTTDVETPANAFLKQK
jgi:hypothetical protein